MGEKQPGRSRVYTIARHARYRVGRCKGIRLEKAMALGSYDARRSGASRSFQMRSRRRWEVVVVALLFAMMSAGAVLAQDQDGAPPPANIPVQQGDPGPGAPQQQQGGPQQQQQDPPGRVARVQYMTGQVSMQPGGVNDWVAASLNRPLTSADRVWTDKDSRAELNTGDGFIRMDSETSLTLTNVNDGTVQIELDQGEVSLSVRHLAPGEVYEVDTPNTTFTVMKSGVYRFDVRPNENQTWVTVRSGYGQATGQGAAVRVNSGMQVRFTGPNSLQHVAYDAPPRDGFEDWAKVRDKRLDDSVSARYVSPGVIGYQDLDANGNWVNTPAYGPVWVPNSVPVGWAPYRFGHWAWIAPWGWTWVDDAPWGFAPFHYGRWVSWNGGWGWAPGPLGYWNPYYAPALVGWIGGPGFSIGVGFGWGGGWGFGVGLGFGWFPLGWGEPFYPRYCGWGHGGWYRGGGWVSSSYIRNVNITNTHINNINNVTNNYRNGSFTNARYGFRNTEGAVTAASKSAIASGAAINKVGGAVPKSDLGKGSVMRTADVSPTRESVTGGRSTTTHVPPASATSRGAVNSAQSGPRPANLEAANQATAARANPASASSATGHSTAGTTASNGAHTQTPGATNNGNRGMSTSSNTTAAQTHSVGNSSTEARNGATTGNNVSRPSSTSGVTNNRTTSTTAGASANNVPRPPASNDTFARGNTANTAANRQPMANSNTGANRPMANGNSASNRPMANGNTAANRTPTANSGQRYGGSGSVPRPPSNYQYHAAPSYSASANYGRPSFGNSAGGNRSYSSSPSYGANRGAYGSTPNSGNRSYGSTPSTGNRSYGSSPSSGNRGYGSSPSYGGSRSSSPSYSARSYGAPRSSGGGYHGGSSGGSHSGGGGGSHGGGSHGR